MGTQSTWGVSASVTTMMFTVLASSLVLLAAVTEGRPHESEWQTYKAIHGKEYSAEEDLMRFSRWLQNKEMVDAHNKADHGYKMALMEHSDCGPGSCQGGMMDSAWDTARNGIETEAAYPYVGRDQSCRFNPSKAVAHTAGHRRVSA